MPEPVKGGDPGLFEALAMLNNEMIINAVISRISNYEFSYVMITIILSITKKCCIGKNMSVI